MLLQSAGSIAHRVGGGVASDIPREYSRWLTSKAALDRIISQSRPGKEYEVRAAFERYMISSINFPDNIDAAQRKFADELQEHGCTSTSALSIIRDAFASVGAHATPDIPPEIIGNTVIYGSFTRRVDPDRLALLRSRANDDAIIRMIIRYSSMMPAGQQWSIPDAVYDVLVNDFGADIEAFASPLNSRMMSRGGNYFSLFRDTDEPFGSRGSFFEGARRDMPGHVSVVNPPFTPDVMERAISQCIDICESGGSKSDTTMIIIVPNWTDADFHSRLLSSRCLQAWKVIPRGNAYFESDSAVIITKFDIAVFILAESRARSDIARIVNAFIPKKDHSYTNRR